jgi:two-component system, NarL family, sensor histidine kinase DevS
MTAGRLPAVRSNAALYALDAATRAIAGELQLDRVLQLIVDSVRDLIGSRYAALGILDPSGFRIERFITSGITPEERALIGPPPSGHGLLGTIIRDGISLRIPDIAAHPDTYGFPPNHPAMHSLLGVPVRIGGETIGNFYLTEKTSALSFSAKDQELVEMFAIHAGIAIQNARLHQRVQELAVVDERLRISRDLHDGIIQSLYAVGLTLEDVPELMGHDETEATDRIDRAIDRLNMTIGDIRTFITALGTGGESGLGGRLRDVVAEIARDPRLGVTLDVAVADDVEHRLSPQTFHELLQIAREAVSNAVRHSDASRLTVGIHVAKGELVLTVEDDGRGFDPTKRPAAGHFGLANLHDRAAAVDGRLDVETAPGRGTRIIVRLPLDAEVARP